MMRPAFAKRLHGGGVTAHVSNTAHFCRCQGKNKQRLAGTENGKQSPVTAGALWCASSSLTVQRRRRRPGAFGGPAAFGAAGLATGTDTRCTVRGILAINLS